VHDPRFQDRRGVVLTQDGQHGFVEPGLVFRQPPIGRLPSWVKIQPGSPAIWGTAAGNSTIVYEGDEPNFLADFPDAEPLSGEDGGDVSFAP
jgi:hypothetical protein